MSTLSTTNLKNPSAGSNNIVLGTDGATALTTAKVTTLADSAGANTSTPAEIASGRAKAWVNFNGTSTVTIRASYNVSSITDNGTGNYTVNFGTAFADADYSHNTTCVNDGVNDAIRISVTSAPTTTAYRFFLSDAAGTPKDSARVSVAIFR
jgi:hypothetical protein